MSTYATLADLQSYLGTQTSGTDPGVYEQITDRINATTASATVGQEALDTAEALIDGYLAVKYAVPVDTSNTRVAEIVRGLAVRMAAFELFAGSPFMNDVIDRIEKLHDDSLSFLKGIGKGTTTLPGATPLSPPTADGSPVLSGGDCRVFTESARFAL